MTPNLITEIIGTILAFVEGFWTIVLGSIKSAVGVFWDPATGLTVIGILGLFGLGVGLVTLGMQTAMRFFKK